MKLLRQIVGDFSGLFGLKNKENVALKHSHKIHDWKTHLALTRQS